MELTHQLGGFDVYGVLVLENAGRAAKDEAKGVNLLVKIAKLEFDFFPRVEVVKFEGLKITNENVAGKFGILDAGEIIERLLLGLSQVAASAFLLDKKRSLPK